MNMSLISRKALTLMSVLLMGFSLLPNLAINAQGLNEKSCRPLGWEPVDGMEVNLAGEWMVFHNTNCRDNWQFSAPATISKEGGEYSAKIGNEDPMTVSVGHKGIVFRRDLTKGAGKDSEGQFTQTWRGQIGMLKDGKIRIYGTWSGAFTNLRRDGFNSDFMMVKQK
jgi:hypothetical protein